MVVDLVRNHIPRRFGLDPVNDIQVLTPMHKGAVGAAQLNLRLQASLNPNGLEVRRGERSFRLHDKVMQIRNNYDKDVFNGDVGRIVFLDGKERTLSVRYDDRVVPYDFEELDELTPAYAISIHKSQGSEYPAVVIPLMMQHYVLLQRNLVYTGVTRGKKLVVLVGESRAPAHGRQEQQDPYPPHPPCPAPAAVDLRSFAATVPKRSRERAVYSQLSPVRQCREPTMDIPSGPSLRPERDSGAGRRHAASPAKARTQRAVTAGDRSKDKATGIAGGLAYHRPAAPAVPGRGASGRYGRRPGGSFRLRGSGSAGSRRSSMPFRPAGILFPSITAA